MPKPLTLSRLALALSIALVLALPTGARAEVFAACDPNAALAVADGTIAAGEYAFTSNGVGSGFGGMLGQGVSMRLDSDAAGNLALAIDATGANCAWGANDSVVVYVDSIPDDGFADTTGFDDFGDSGRKAASGGSADLTFAPGFGADYALVIRGDSASVFRLVAGGAHEFVRAANRAPAADFGTSCVKELDGFSMADLGSRAGNPLRFVATLLNPEDGAGQFRSNEFQGVEDATVPAANIGSAAFVLGDGDRNSFVTHGFGTAISTGFAWIDFATFAGAGFEPTPTDCGRLSSQSWSARASTTTSVSFGGTVTSGTLAQGVWSGSTTGGAYAFEHAPNDRALGAALSGSAFAPGSFTLRVRNDGASTLTGLSISYRALGFNNGPRANRIAFATSSDGTTFTNDPTVAFTTPGTADDSWVSESKSTTVIGLSVAPGDYVYLRWTTEEAGGSGARDKLAIDDIVVRNLPDTCGDGTLDAGEDCDDGAANGTTVCGCQTSCTYAAADVVCADAGSDACDAPDTCDGAGACVPRVAAAGTECRAAAGLCDVAEVCDGTSKICPPDDVRPAGTPCRDADGVCDAPEACDGTDAECPADVPAADGTACGDDMVCNGAEVCMSGACMTPGALDCDDGDACTADSCAEPAGCEHAPIAGCCNTNAECDDGDPCTMDTCSANACEHVNTCTDAGVMDDAGVPGVDAGVQVDAGADASTPDDGGLEDAAMPMGDAGVTPVTADCSCRAVTPSSDDPSPLWLALLGVAYVIRRRR